VETITRRVREVRRRHGWNQQQLAEQMTKAGVAWDRNVVANLETGRRASVGVDELLALAHVLSVAPLSLLIPLDDKTPYQLTPTVTKPAEEVRDWAHGVITLNEQGEPKWDDIDWRIYESEVPDSEWRAMEELYRARQRLDTKEPYVKHLIEAVEFRNRQEEGRSDG
jgi:transcriptional regulator with XRE-family HTH domain